MERTGVKRLESLDYLRGLMAFAVMVFHYDKWTTGVWTGNSLQGKLGVYAVSVFFIISGMALTHTYAHALRAPGAWKSFARKRILRIFPLLWLATTATLLIDDHPRPLHTILFNYSGLFGFVNPADDVATGAWSIGCELVYYAFFPFLLWMKRPWVLLSAGFLTVTGLGLAFFGPFCRDGVDQSVWWPAYTRAINHAWFFTAGVCAILYADKLQAIGKTYWLALFSVALAGFVLADPGPDPIWLVSGWWRVFLSLTSVLFALAWSMGIESFRGILHGAMAWLGAVSYSLYLLHPIVFRAVQSLNRQFLHADMHWIPVMAALMSMIAAHLSYHYFEKPLMRLAHRKPAA